MFYEVKRTKQALTKEVSFSVLETEKRGVLSIESEEGYPYGVPMNHYFSKEENRIYFHGGKIGYKIDCIQKNNRCSFTVVKEIGKEENGWAAIFESVIVFGKIYFANEESEMLRIAELLSRKFTSDERYIQEEIAHSGKNTQIFYLEIEHITGKRVIEK